MCLRRCSRSSVLAESYVCQTRAKDSPLAFPMLTRVKRETEKNSKTANLCINLMKVGMQRRIDKGFIKFHQICA